MNLEYRAAKMGTRDTDFKTLQIELFSKLSFDARFLYKQDIEFQEVLYEVLKISTEENEKLQSRLIHVDIQEVVTQNWEMIKSQSEKSKTKFVDLRKRKKSKVNEFWNELKKAPIRLRYWYDILFFLPHIITTGLIISLLIHLYSPGTFSGILPENLFETNVYTLSIISIIVASVASHLLYRKTKNIRLTNEKMRLNNFIDDLNLKSLFKEIEKERRELLESYISSALLTIKEHINKILSEDWLLELNGFDSSNFYISDDVYAIDTAGLSIVRKLLDRIDGGAIGLSGRRGVGKTTLLNAIVGEDQKGDKKRLSLILSVPTVYDSRQFILHLISVFCKKILERSGKDELDGHANLTRDYSAKNSYERILMRWKSFSRFGVILSIFAAFLTFLGMIDSNLYIATFTEFLDNLGISLSGMFLGGLSIIIASIAMYMYSREMIESRNNGFTLKSEPMNYDSLVDSARNWIQLTKYQQTYTSGWGGAIKNIGPVELKSETAISFSQYQLTFPELISSFRELVKLASDEYEVIIAIDELDKLEADEHAVNFLNEIKGLFGLKGVYYLISISESALKSFESRGFFKRDVFDSSFDHVVNIPRLELNESVNLIHRRVVGLPIVFIALCHVLSAGIPRELIRNCREIARFSNDSNNDINSVSEKIICGKITQIVHFIDNHEMEKTVYQNDKEHETFLEKIEMLSNKSPGKWPTLTSILYERQIHNSRDVTLFVLSQVEIMRRLWNHLNIDISDPRKLDEAFVETLSKLKYQSEFNPKKTIKDLLSEN